VIGNTVYSLVRSFAGFGLAALLVLSAAPVRADEAAPAQGHAATLDNPLAAVSLDELTATRDRPLFARSRRPPAPPPSVHVEAPPPPPPPPPDVAFYGTVVDSEGASAIIRGGPSEKIVQVRVGDEVDGWSVERIESRELVLSLDDRTVSFTMFDAHHPVEHTAAMGHSPPIVEVNAAGIKRAHRPRKQHP